MEFRVAFYHPPGLTVSLAKERSGESEFPMCFGGLGCSKVKVGNILVERYFRML